MSDLFVACVKWGTKYPADYVLRLRNMVARHLGTPHRFVCFTEDKEGLDSVACRALPDDYEGWWNKISLFREDVFPCGATVIFLDLDVVIVSSVGFLAEMPGDFVICDLFTKGRSGRGYNSSVMRFPAGRYAQVHERFTEWRSGPGIPPFRGDQDFIHHHVRGAAVWPRQRIISYKLDVGSADGPIGDQAAILVFHGKPKPHDLLRDQFAGTAVGRLVREHWR